MVQCRTPTVGKDGITRIPGWKYRAVRAAILDAVADAGPSGLLFRELSDQVRSRLDADDLTELGSVGWHVTTVKLDMEVEGELLRVAGATPQRLVLG